MGKSKISDFGGQSIVKGDNGKFYREPDGLEVEYVEQAREPKRLQLKYTDILHWYFSRQLLYPKDNSLNGELYATGLKYQKLWYKACYTPKVTALLDKDHIPSDLDTTNTGVMDAQNKLWKTNKYISKYVPILYQVLIENLPAKRKIESFRRAMVILNDYWSNGVIE